MNKKNILLVEDEMIIALNEKMQLEKYGFNVITVTTAEKAIDLVKNSEEVKIDLILMDIDLKEGMDGIEAAKIILNHKEIPIIFLTNYSKSDIISEAEKVSPYGYIVKGSFINIIEVFIKLAFKLHETRQSKNYNHFLVNTLLTNTSDSIVVTDADFFINYVNKITVDMYDISIDDILGYDISKLNPDFSKNNLQNKLNDYFSTGNECFGESVYKKKNNSFIYIEYKIIPLIDVDKASNNYIVIQKDITKRKEDEITIKKQNKDLISANNEKEVLFREVHHRVKNNLQIIQSILNMQKNYISGDEKTIAVLDECISRLSSMAYIHESFYQTDNMSSIDMKAYIEKLIFNIHSFFINNYTLIEYNVDVNEVYFEINKAVPFGLLLNEIISNCFKHAFKDKDNGHIYISLKKINDKYELKVKDNGIGLPDTIDFNETQKTYGLTLISAFINQLHASVEIIRNWGTEYIIIF